jgi:hypothetical protein
MMGKEKLFFFIRKQGIEQQLRKKDYSCLQV